MSKLNFNFNFVSDKVLSYQSLDYYHLLKTINRISHYYLDKHKDIAHEISKQRQQQQQNKERSRQFFLSNNQAGFGPVRPEFKRDTYCSAPFIDGEMFKIIESNNRQSIPTTIGSETVDFKTDFLSKSKLDYDDRRKYNQRTKSGKLFSSEVRQSDQECIISYTSSSVALSPVQINGLIRSGIEAAKQLGITPQSIRKQRECTKGISESEFNKFSSKFESVQKNEFQSLNDRIKCSVISTAKNTNSGWPLFKKKNSTLCINDTISWLVNVFKKPNHYSIFKNPLVNEPNYIFHRVQPVVEADKCKAKIRQVWCAPQRIIALEHYFFQDILNVVKENNINGNTTIYSSGLTNYQISNSIVSRIRSLINTSRNHYVYSTDFSKYDRNIPDFAIDIFYSIMYQCLCLSDNDDKLFELLRQYSKYTPFIFEGKLHFKVKGIFSGSYITNLFDTWWNLTLWIQSYHIKNNLSSLIKTSSEINPKSMLRCLGSLRTEPTFDDRLPFGLCGDDAIIYCSPILIDIHRNLCKGMDITVSVKYICKSESEPCFFLGRYWDQDSIPYQSEVYITSHIIFRCKFYKKEDLPIDISKYLSITRLLSICCPLKNGKDYLDKTFYNYGPYQDFLKNRFPEFILLKDWQQDDEFIKINRLNAFNWETY